MKQLSIIIPMYNVVHYLPKCIASVYNQNLRDDIFEILLIDDESPDNSLQVAQELTQSKKNVTIISQQNKGLGGARNTGIDNAKGDYIIFLDSDDWFLANSLQQVLKIVATQVLDIVEFGAQGINEDGSILYTASISSNNCITNGVAYYQKYRYLDSACNKLYNRNFLNNNNLRFIEKLFIEDYEFNTRAFIKAHKVLATNAIISCFLQTQNSITRNNSSIKKEKMKSDVIEVINRIAILKKENSQLDPNYFDQRLGYITTTLFYQLFKNKEPIIKYYNLKKSLKQADLFFLKNRVFDTKKNIFRMLLLFFFMLPKLKTK